MEETETRNVFLIVYRSRLFNAHWGMVVPYNNTSTVGTKIHVTGTLRDGFEHEFQRDYDPEATGRAHSLFALGAVDASAVATLASADPGDMTTPSNRLEQLALTVPAPGPSLRSSSRGEVSGPTERHVARIDEPDRHRPQSASRSRIASSG